MLSISELQLKIKCQVEEEKLYKSVIKCPQPLHYGLLPVFLNAVLTFPTIHTVSTATVWIIFFIAFTQNASMTKVSLIFIKSFRTPPTANFYQQFSKFTYFYI